MHLFAFNFIINDLSQNKTNLTMLIRDTIVGIVNHKMTCSIRFQLPDLKNTLTLVTTGFC